MYKNTTFVSGKKAEKWYFSEMYVNSRVISQLFFSIMFTIFYKIVVK